MSNSFHSVFKHNSVRIFLLSLTVVFTMTTGSVFAQNEVSAKWRTVVAAGTHELFGTAVDACLRQYEIYAPNQSKFRGVIERDQFDEKLCDWCTTSEGCGIGSNPTLVLLSCHNADGSFNREWHANGHKLIAPGICVPKPQRPAPMTCGPNETAGNPTVLKSGTKVEFATDFATYDGLLRLDRTYRNNFGTAGTYKTQNPLGYNWRFGFEWNLTLNRSFKFNRTVDILAPDGAAYSYKINSDGSSSPTSSQVTRDIDVKLISPAVLDTQAVIDNGAEIEIRDRDGNSILVELYAPKSGAKFATSRVKKITSRDGYELSFSYPDANTYQLTSIVDSYGRALSFNWHTRANPRSYGKHQYVNNDAGAIVPLAVESVDLPDGSKVQYSYTPYDPSAWPASSTSSSGLDQYQPYKRLEKVEQLDTAGQVVDSTSYLHDGLASRSYYLNGITGHDGVRLSTYAYDGYGRVTLSEHVGGNNKTTFSYGKRVEGSTTYYVTTATNALGKVTEYKYKDIFNKGFRLEKVDGQASTNCVASNSAYAYSGNFVSKITDEEGYETRFSRDSNGRPTKITRAYGTADSAVTDLVWNNDVNKPSQIETEQLQTDYVYNAVGQLTSVTQTDVTSHTVPYSTNGQIRTWAYTYTPTGKIASIDGPLAGTADTTTYTYDTPGNLTQSTDELGHVSKILTVNGRGYPTQVEDQNGIVTDIAYDTANRLTSVTVDAAGVSSVTSFNYDALGQVTQVTNADGSQFNYAYSDVRRLTSITDANSNKVTYTHDLMGNITATKIEDGTSALLLQQTAVYDELGRLLKAIGASNQEWTYAYDKVSNLTDATDPRNNSTTLGYNGLRQLIQETDAASATTQTEFTSGGDVTKVTDAGAVVTDYVRNGFGEIIEETSPDVGTITYVRDALGNITQRTDARAVVAQYAYDAAGRLTGVTYPSSAAENVTLTYDQTTGGNLGLGRLTQIVDEAGTTALTYNAAGLVASRDLTISGITLTTTFEYDAAGNLQHITYPSGRTISTWRNTEGEISSVSMWANATAPLEQIASNADWMPFSNALKSLDYENGLSVWNTYDQDYQADQRGLFDGSTSIIQRTYGRQDDMNITNIWDNVTPANNQSYWYSNQNMLQNGDGPWGAFEFYQDGVGNITWKNETVSGTTTGNQFNYEAGTNRLSTIYTGGNLSRSFGYDANGNITSDANGGTTKTYTYNHANRLSAVNENGSAVATYTYNARNQLGTRSVTSGLFAGTTAYVYDLEGHVIAEYDAVSQTLRKEYIWLLDAPLAVIDHSTGSPALFYVHTDHLGLPIAMSDGTKTLVAQWKWLPFGGLHQFTGTQEIDLRFPGQSLHAETGLHYNWHRHYDPTIGRYTQADPLGLIDGPNRYAYVKNDPLQLVDPDGRESQSSTPIPLPFPPWLPPQAFDDRFNEQLNDQMGRFLGVCKALFLPQFILPSQRPRGAWDAVKGAEEWGRRNGFGKKGGRDKFHDVKWGGLGAGADEDFSVNPDTGEIFDSNGEDAGNLND